MKILISGGTGFVGQRLVRKLSFDHELYLLTRSTEKAKKLFSENTCSRLNFIEWSNLNTEFNLSTYGKMDAVINLIGENIASKKWSNEQKKILFNSRIDSTKTIILSLKKNQKSLDHFISTSAVGIYTEGFLHKLCTAWEKAIVSEDSNFIKRSCILRVGMVIGKNGGAMQKILPPFRAGLGGKLASGLQWMSWVHVEDLANMYIEVLKNSSFNGAINAVSPFSIKNIEFTEVLGKILRKPTRLSVPIFVLKLTMGEMSSIVLDSIKVEPKELKKNKFHYLYPTIELAIKDVVSKK